MESTARIDTNILAKPMANWIAGAIKHPGTLSAQAKATGKTVKQFIAKPPKRANTKTKQRIALAKTLEKLRKRKGK